MLTDLFDNLVSLLIGVAVVALFVGTVALGIRYPVVFVIIGTATFCWLLGGIIHLWWRYN